MTSEEANDGTNRLTRERGRTDVGRRSLLAALGAAAVGTGFAGPAAANQYGTVVDIVADEGADDTGGESITPVLDECREKYGDDTLLEFPSGEYYMDEQFRFTGFSNVGLVGNDATIVPANYHDFDGPQYRLFRLGVPYSPGRGLQFEGFTVDQSAADTGIRTVEAYVEDGLEVRDVTVDGKHDSGTWGPALFAITESGGSGVVERFEAPDGGVLSSNAPGDINVGPTGILLTRNHQGTIELRDCALGGFPDNGLYAASYGTVRVVGGRYENSNVASVRLGGYDCRMRNVAVTVDSNPQDFPNQRGIRLDAGTGFVLDGVTIDLPAPNGHAITIGDHVGTTRIEDVDITIGDEVNHGIVIQSGAGETAIVDSTVEIARGGNAIRIEDDGGTVVCARVQVWGKASGARFRHAIRCERDDCEFRTVKVWQPGPDKRRAICLDADDCLLYDGEFKTRHHPLLVNGTGAWIEANYAECYDDHEAIRLNDESADATIKNNTLVDGVLDKGCDGLRMYGNTIR